MKDLGGFGVKRASMKTDQRPSHTRMHARRALVLGHLFLFFQKVPPAPSLLALQIRSAPTPSPDRNSMSLSLRPTICVNQGCLLLAALGHCQRGVSGCMEHR